MHSARRSLAERLQQVAPLINQGAFTFDRLSKRVEIAGLQRRHSFFVGLGKLSVQPSQIPHQRRVRRVHVVV